MGRFTPPASGGVETLNELTDVDTSGGDGLLDGAPLTYIDAEGKWSPKRATVLSVQRQSGPARDAFESYAITSLVSNLGGGNAEFDGALWRASTSNVARLDFDPDGINVTIGTTDPTPSGSVPRAHWATTTDALYLQTWANGASQRMYRVLGVDTLTALAPNTLGAGGGTGTRAQSMVGVGNRVYQVGFDATFQPGAFVYDPWTDSWSSLTPPPVTVDDNDSLTAYDGSLYLLNGNGFHEYDVSEDTWYARADAPASMGIVKQKKGIQVGSLLYYFGSEDGAGSGNVWWYSPEADVWEEGAGASADVNDINQTRSTGGACWAYINGRIWLIEGTTTVVAYG